jgi:hypothetical protein
VGIDKREEIEFQRVDSIQHPLAILFHSSNIQNGCWKRDIMERLPDKLMNELGLGRKWQ